MEIDANDEQKKERGQKEQLAEIIDALNLDKVNF